MFAAAKVLRDPAIVGAATDPTEKRGDIPVIGNFIASDNYQSLQRAQRDFLNSAYQGHCRGRWSLIPPAVHFGEGGNIPGGAPSRADVEAEMRRRGLLK